MSEELLLGILGGLDIGSARGRRPQGADLEVKGALGEADLPLIINPPELSVETPALKRVTQRHHTLAKLLADGVAPAECSLITGHSISRISILRHDPAFKDLVEYYKAQAQAQYIGVHQRLADLGDATVAELQERLEEAPESFSNKQLTDLMGAVLDRSTAPSKAAGGPSSIKISFVSAEPQALVLDGEVVDITPKV